MRWLCLLITNHGKFNGYVRTLSCMCVCEYASIGTSESTPITSPLRILFSRSLFLCRSVFANNRKWNKIFSSSVCILFYFLTVWFGCCRWRSAEPMKMYMWKMNLQTGRWQGGRGDTQRKREEAARKQSGIKCHFESIWKLISVKMLIQFQLVMM